ncbi:MAG: phytanoyl-CoA dioxygenase family protein, partial [Campylobacteraceae bacterium]|nr:phytanoyl-CoA dioxygenase family protein [Campylobacteraceae bacterium]
LDKSRFDTKSNFLDAHSENAKLIKTAIHSNLQKGDVVLFHCRTLHHANKNTTQKEKISFVYTVRACDNNPQKDTISDYKEIFL